ncbi:hypothetical protein TNCV_5092211 [Trichonephila clavipes]|nr:hypothetical protein TNCV_5092211 [Trichonephila clavipes]
MRLIYALAEGNARLTERLYRERYPQRDAPDRLICVRENIRTTCVASSEVSCIKIPPEVLFRYENCVSWTIVTHVGAPVAWELRIIDTVVATPVIRTFLQSQVLGPKPDLQRISKP